jgi:mannose-1-phosphate guanylyltransferase
MHRFASAPPVETDDPVDWTLALAGGDGVRLADYVERRFGRRIPKQYCCLLGARSMLQHTLDRTNHLTPPSRTLAVIGTDHGAIAAPQLVGLCNHVFRQPASRDTGVALYVAIAMIKRWTPNAVITITPTDHYVTPARRYVEQLRSAQVLAARRTDSVVVIGARPSEPDPELGYLALGAALPEIPRVHTVVAFVEKPPESRALELQRAGALWNTMVTCGSVSALWDLGRAACPDLLEMLDSLIPLIGTPDEGDAIDYIYRVTPPISFSRDMLEHAPSRLVALALDGIEWSDWGRSDRIEATIARRRERSEHTELAPRAAYL